MLLYFYILERDYWKLYQKKSIAILWLPWDSINILPQELEAYNLYLPWFIILLTSRRVPEIRSIQRNGKAVIPVAKRTSDSLCVTMWGDSTWMHSLRKQGAKAFLHCLKWVRRVDLLDTDGFPQCSLQRTKSKRRVSGLYQERRVSIFAGKNILTPSFYLTSSVHPTKASLWATLKTDMPSSRVFPTFAVLFRLSMKDWSKKSKKHVNTPLVMFGVAKVQSATGQTLVTQKCALPADITLSTAWCSQKGNR